MSKILTRQDYFLAWLSCLILCVIVSVYGGVIGGFIISYILESSFGIKVYGEDGIENLAGVAIGTVLSFTMFVLIVKTMIVPKVESRIKQKLLQEYCEEFEKKNPLEKEEKNENEL